MPDAVPTETVRPPEQRLPNQEIHSKAIEFIDRIREKISSWPEFKEEAAKSFWSGNSEVRFERNGQFFRVYYFGGAPDAGMAPSLDIRRGEKPPESWSGDSKIEWENVSLRVGRADLKDASTRPWVMYKSPDVYEETEWERKPGVKEKSYRSIESTPTAIRHVEQFIESL